jgi:hypothetical protein
VHRNQRKEQHGIGKAIPIGDLGQAVNEKRNECTRRVREGRRTTTGEIRKDEDGIGSRMRQMKDSNVVIKAGRDNQAETLDQGF